MNIILGALISGVAAFAATNLDDLFLLMLYFSRANNNPQREGSIIMGQYLGFSVLVFISVLGYLGTLLIPRHYVGWLGVLPIFLGVRELLSLRQADEQEEQQVVADAQEPAPPGIFRSRLLSWLNPQTSSIAAVTVANGSDNLAVYTPLFAAGGITQMVIIIAVLLLMVRVWCFIADWLAENPVTAGPLRRYGRLLMPFVLMGIGLTILIESGALEFFMV
ncbi:MAG: transporter [Anaerolineae bacterium]|nr:transporter [Anaerolineae bacterium]